MRKVITNIQDAVRFNPTKLTEMKIFKVFYYSAIKKISDENFH